MNRTSFVLCLAAAMVATVGCSTKNYVKSQTTPLINKTAGRDHWPGSYSMVLAGGGIKGGQIYGQTDAVAGSVKDFPVRPDDLAATLYECLGIPADTILVDSRQRPHAITEGKPVRALVA